MGEPIREAPPPGECRRLTAEAAGAGKTGRAIMWALLAIAGELADINRELKRRPR